MSITDFKREVKEKGSIFQSGSSITLQDIDDIIARLKLYWEDEEILIYCSPKFTNKLINAFNIEGELADYGVFKSEGVATRFISEMSFYRGGLTFHVIEKPNIGSGALWMSVSADAKPHNSLIII